MPTSKSLAVWILGFGTFTAALTTFHSVLLLTQYGPAATFENYLLSPYIGPIQVTVYFWASLILTSVLFGATSFAAFRYSLEFDTLIKLGSVLNFNTKHLIELLAENSKAVEETKQSLSQGLDTKIENLKHEIVAQIKKQQKTIQTIKKHAAVAVETKRKIKKLERKLKPKPKLSINDKPEKIKGIGPSLARKLKVIGVTNLGELINADPLTITIGTQLPTNKAKVLQAKAKMLVIAGLDEKEVDALEQIGMLST